MERSKLYTYDGDGTLVKSVVNGVSTYYPSTVFQEEGTKITKYYNLGGQRVAMRVSGVLSWLVTDHLGSTNVTANADGTLQSEMRYRAFGETRYTNGITPTDYRYTGQLQQAEAGLYFYNARWYDPQLGRFIQADTVVPGAGNAKAYDRYAYVLNNPINFNDPSGHICSDDFSLPCVLRPGERAPMQSALNPVKREIVFMDPTLQTSSTKSSSSGKSGSRNADGAITVNGLTNKENNEIIDRQTINACGSYALAAYISLLTGKKVSGADVDSYLVSHVYKISGMGVLGVNLANAANKFNPANKYLYQKGGTINDLIDNVNAGKSTIVGWSNEDTDTLLFDTPVEKITVGHWVTVIGYNPETSTVIFANPWSGNIEELIYNQFNEKWNGQPNFLIGNGDIITSSANP